MSDLLPLCVPPWDERVALAEGALYDDILGFHVHKDNVYGLEGFLPRMYRQQPALLPDMLPDTTWEQNIRQYHGQETWNRLRKHAYANAGFRCEICGEKGKLEAHEHWEFDNDNIVQRLVGLYCLCTLCHKVHHLGLAKRMGIYADVKDHLRRVNNWTEIELYDALGQAYEVWQQRCEYTWAVDLSIVMDSSYAHVNKNGLGSYEII